MPKFRVHHEEAVNYETVIVEATDADEAERLVREADPRDFDSACEDGDEYQVEAVETDAGDLKEYREVEIKDGEIVPFKPWRGASRKVVIEVSGGVAEITSQPEDVDVEIIDHDNA